MILLINIVQHYCVRSLLNILYYYYSVNKLQNMMKNGFYI